MARKKLIFSVSDSEIFDAYMSAPIHFSENALLEEGRRRSIIYSKYENAEALARKLSRQVFGYRELQPIEQYFSQLGRGAKTSSIKIDTPVQVDELRSVIEELATSPERTEDITSYVDGVDIVVNAAYTETDFSKNRLRQRQQKEAKVRFEIAVDSVTVTSPATSKGRDLVKAVINRLEERRKAVLNVEEVDLSGIRDSFLRTLFFTKLCSGLPNATLNDVVRVKLQSTNKGTSDGDEADEEDEEEDINLDIGVTKTEEVVAGVLRAAALNGQDLFGTSVFQELREKGFYLTSVTWRSRLQEPGNPIVEFNADFEDSENCRMFTYTANTWKIRRTTGEYNESFTSIPADKKADLLKMLHRFALSTMHEVAKEQASSSQSPAKANGGDSEPN